MSDLPAHPHGNGECPTQRGLDALDAATLNYAATLILCAPVGRFFQQNGGKIRAPNALDIGCGEGVMSEALAEHGLNVTAIDLQPSRIGVEYFYDNPAFGRLEFQQEDITRIPEHAIPCPLDIVYSQRALHYFPHSKASDLVDKINRRLAPTAVIAVSVMGTRCPIVKGLPGIKEPLNHRHFKLPRDRAERWNIERRVCPYTKQDLRRLFEGADVYLKDGKVHETRFGMLKAIFIRDSMAQGR